MLYLQSASNDFKSLIETINVEKEWSENQESQKRPSVAWEIRKSMSSPNPTSIKDKPLHPISSIIAEAVKNVSPTQESSEKTAPAALTYARITAAAAVAAVAVSHPGDSGGAADGWKVVSNRRRKSTSSTTVSEFDREMSVEKEKETNEQIPLNVYERLSSNSYKRGSQPINRTLTCPRSAMDLPQTRASMAKMAYSRQLLWEKNQQVLVEKLRAKQKKEKSTRQCGFTFADPQAVRKSVEAFNQQKSNRKGGKVSGDKFILFLIVLFNFSNSFETSKVDRSRFSSFCRKRPVRSPRPPSCTRYTKKAGIRVLSTRKTWFQPIRLLPAPSPNRRNLQDPCSVTSRSLKNWRKTRNGEK